MAKLGLKLPFCAHDAISEETKSKTTFGDPFSVINKGNRDSLLGRLTQSISRDLHFERPLCRHGSNYYDIVYFAHIPAVG